MYLKYVTIILAVLSLFGHVATIIFGSIASEPCATLPLVFVLFALTSVIAYILYELEKKTSHLLDIHTFDA